MIDQKEVRLFARLVGWLAVTAITILSLVPGDMRPHTGAPPTLEHVFAYLVAAGLLSFGYGKSRHPAVVALCLSIYSAALEIAQILIPGRNADFLDFAVSSIGAFIGFALVWIFLRALQRAV